MTVVQLSIADIESATDAAPFTAADLDEWIASVERSTWDTGHWPNAWAREGLAALLGKPVPHGRWLTKELLATLRNARAINGGA